jgi:hypothetical protein
MSTSGVAITDRAFDNMDYCAADLHVKRAKRIGLSVWLINIGECTSNGEWYHPGILSAPLPDSFYWREWLNDDGWYPRVPLACDTSYLSRKMLL